MEPQAHDGMLKNAMTISYRNVTSRAFGAMNCK
jgi:hypothetical protein